MEDKLIPQYTRGRQRKRNPKWRHLSYQMTKARREGDIERYRQLERQRRTLPSKDPCDDGYRRLKYCRYADDFILGFAGPRSEAEEIKAKVGAFLKRIKLSLSDDKTLITHARTSRARFLGYEIYVTRSDNRLTECQRDNKKLKTRAVNGSIMLSVPQDVAQEWCARYSSKGKPIHRTKLLCSSDYEIVMTFNLEIHGLLNYYALAHNIAKRLSLVRYVYLQSMVKTLAAKHKQSSAWVYRRYTRKLEDGRKVIVVTIPRDPPKKPLVAMFGPHSLARDPKVTLKDRKPYTYLTRTELVKRLLNGKCELCGSTERIEVHHVRKLADVRKKYHGREPPQWVVFMLGRRRKTVVVCQICHKSIHAGTYDGPKLN